MSYLAGARLVRQGEGSRGAFLLRTGEVEAQVALPGGGMLTVARLRDGDVFGEMALIENGVCSASVVARTNVDGWFIERGDFRALVASRDQAALDAQRAITKLLAEKLRALNAKVEERAAAEQRPSSSFKDGSSERKKPGFDWRAFLPILPFFEGFDDYEIEDFVAGAAALELPRGATLFAAGRPADACYLVVRGAVEVLHQREGKERRIALAGPGELVGYLALIEGQSQPAGGRHTASARVRESACVLELKAQAFLAHYNGESGTAVRLQHAIHRNLLRSLGRTNTQLTRLITHARLAERGDEARELETALHGQIYR
ncbi:MAG TPA: cyclic nucleotide-binding domain-containing protein [Burkholderiales bacterium]